MQDILSQFATLERTPQLAPLLFSVVNEDTWNLCWWVKNGAEEFQVSMIEMC